MNYTVRIYWNHKLCLMAACTAVMAHDTVAAFLNDSFGGVAYHHWLAEHWPSTSMDDILAMKAGAMASLEWSYSDTTGAAMVWIERARD